LCTDMIDTCSFLPFGRGLLLLSICFHMIARANGMAVSWLSFLGAVCQGVVLLL
jgi:hypothetical protein